MKSLKQLSFHNSHSKHSYQFKMMMVKSATILALAVAGAQGYPKIEVEDKGFQPLKSLPAKDQLAMESDNQLLTPNAADKAGRFGFPTFNGDGQNYPQTVNNVVPGLYGPVKLDIGGLVLGTIVGLGAFFILPKLLHVIAGPHGGYKRSEDSSDSEGNLSEIYRRVSDSLEAMNLDTTSCVQRAICTSVQSSNSKDGIFDSIARNDMVRTVLGGSDWERALKVGVQGDSCGLAFPKCPFTVDSVIKPLVKYFNA